MPNQYIPDHPENAHDAVQSRWTQEPLVDAVIEATGQVVQDVEDAIFDMRTSSKLDVATDEYLDQWGSLVGEARGDLSGSEYRRIIQAKIAANRSNGRPDGVATTIETLFDPDSFRIIRYESGSARIIVFVEEDFSDVFVNRATPLFESAFALGVSIYLTKASSSAALQFDKPAPNSLDTGTFGDKIT
jgi:hypothetical protein